MYCQDCHEKAIREREEPSAAVSINYFFSNEDGLMDHLDHRFVSIKIFKDDKLPAMMAGTYTEAQVVMRDLIRVALYVKWVHEQIQEQCTAIDDPKKKVDE